MSYIDKSLGDGETIIARAHFPGSTSRGLAALLLPLILLALLLASLSAQFATTQPAHLADRRWRCCFVLGLLIFLRMMIRKWTTEIGVTSHRFVEKNGLLSMRTNEIALPNIEGVRVNQSIAGPHLRLWHGQDRRHRRGFGDHAHHRRSGRFCARHPDREGTYRGAVRGRERRPRRLPPVPGRCCAGR